jgi:transcriptional regulator with XRE-family HTH domain
MVKKAGQATPNHLLREARQERGWTQKDVADRIGAPLDLNVTRWERGTARPSAFYVQKLCELFGKSARELGLLPLQQPAGMANGNELKQDEPAHPSRDLPAGTVTMFFIDMAESTRL